ncbi:MAG TPA: helicase-related protein [Polyangiaceae bacterium]|nr:helicase-related protein [Polyangiaceae bacterium]
MDRAPITAVLGPTNTGKTHLALERMLEHPDGVIGFPLRLLARENYDKLRRALGPDEVALVTGEEKIVPRRARYFSCTVEAMPVDRDAAFVAVDEIQLAADPERGHVFTDRLLRARGTRETMFLGAETARPVLSRLLPHAEHVRRPRLSELAYTGPRKLTRLPPRSAVIAFSVEEVYALAELLRRHRGGTAVVLGALSPRTRNAQVALYQEGQVDYLVATDAIGMGLNLDIDHVAFASLRKFDGEHARELTPPEFAQIAGRAGRALRNGTFGTTADAPPLPPPTIEAIERHAFAPLGALYWRNSDLDFASLEALSASLKRPPPHPALVRGREADDARAFAVLARRPEIAALARGRARLELLWEVCQVPDYRKLTAEAHAALLFALYRHLVGPSGRLPTDWVERHIAELDRTEGDVHDLVARIANVRTWTYVTNREPWVDDARRLQALARAVEDRLSDALHERLTQRFVDRLAATMVRRAREGREVGGALLDDGRVLVEGTFVGRVEGFRFAAEGGGGAEGRVQRAAALKALRGPIGARVEALCADDDGAFALGAGRELSWRGAAVGRLTRAASALRPGVEALESPLLEPAQAKRVAERLAAWARAAIGLELGPLVDLARAELRGPARGLAYQLVQGLGAVRRAEVDALLAALAPDDRQALEGLGVRAGALALYVEGAFAPAAVAWRSALWALHFDRPELAPSLSPPGAPSLPLPRGAPPAFALAAGYWPLGGRAYRLDALEAVAAEAAALARRGPFAPPEAWASRLGAPRAEVSALLLALGYRARGEGAAALFFGKSTKRRRRRRGRAPAPAPAGPAGPTGP